MKLKLLLILSCFALCTLYSTDIDAQIKRTRDVLMNQQSIKSHPESPVGTGTPLSNATILTNNGLRKTSLQPQALPQEGVPTLGGLSIATPRSIPTLNYTLKKRSIPNVRSIYISPLTDTGTNSERGTITDKVKDSIKKQKEALIKQLSDN